MRCSRHCRGLVSWCHRFGYLRDVREGINGLITDILSSKATNTLLLQPLHPTNLFAKGQGSGIGREVLRGNELVLPLASPDLSESAV